MRSMVHHLPNLLTFKSPNKSRITQPIKSVRRCRHPWAAPPSIHPLYNNKAPSNMNPNPISKVVTTKVELLLTQQISPPTQTSSPSTCPPTTLALKPPTSNTPSYQTCSTHPA